MSGSVKLKGKNCQCHANISGFTIYNLRKQSSALDSIHDIYSMGPSGTWLGGSYVQGWRPRSEGLVAGGTKAL